MRRHFETDVFYGNYFPGSWLEHGPSRAFLIVAATALGIFAFGLAGGILLGGESRWRLSPAHFVKGLRHLGWGLPIAAVFVCYGIWLTRTQYSTNYRPVAPVSMFENVVHPPLGAFDKVVAHERLAGAVVNSQLLQPTITEPLPPELPMVTAVPVAPAAATPPPAAVATAPKTQSVVVPDWISQGDIDSADRRLVVVTSQFAATEAAAEQGALDRAVDRLAGDFSAHVPAAANWRPPMDVVRTQAIRHVHVEQIDRETISSGTPFHVYRAHLQLEISPGIRNLLFPIWKEQIVGHRLAALGGLAGLLTLSFATAAAYFRLDERTMGQRRRRLKLAAVSLICAGGFAAALLLKTGFANTPPDYRHAAKAASVHSAARNPTFAEAAKRGLDAFDKRDFAQAIRHFDEAIRLDPDHSEARRWLGDAFLNRHEFDKALSAYEEAIQLDPKNAMAYLCRGMALTEKRESGPAIVAFETALRLDPKLAKRPAYKFYRAVADSL